MSGAFRFRELPFARTAIEVGISWIVGTTASLILGLAAEGQLFDFSPMMIGGALGWFGLVFVPIFLVAWIPLAAIRDRLQPSIGAAIFLVILFGISVYCLSRPEMGDPYGQAFFRMLGSTGMTWSIIIGATILLWRNRSAHAS